MSDEPSSVRLADTVAELLYGIAGWLLIGLGGLAFVGGAGGLVRTAGTAEMVVPLLLLGVAFAFVGLGVFYNPRFRRRLDRRREISRIGRHRTVDSRVRSAPERRREPCVGCGAVTTEGLVRRCRAELLVAGVPVWTRSERRNVYCPSCATEYTSEHGTAGESDTERIAAADG
jgi:hypothetical protein